MNNHETRRGGKAFSLTEVLITVNVMIVGLLGFDSALKTAQAQVRGNQEASLAEAEILSAVEEFRTARARDLNETLAAYRKGVVRMLRDSPMGQDVRLTARLVPDEHRNEKGKPSSAEVLQLTITWDGVLGPQKIRRVSPISAPSQR